MKEVIDQLSKKLKLPLPGVIAHQKLAPYRSNVIPEHITPRHSAVMCLLYPEKGEWYVVLIKRNPYEGTHSAQVSFPGGSKDENDQDLWQTATRETQEEIGVSVPETQILGNLTPVYIPPSNFLVQPVVSWLNDTPEFSINSREVNYLIRFPLFALRHPDLQKLETVTISAGLKMKVPCFVINNEIVWGATAIILSEIRDLLTANC